MPRIKRGTSHVKKRRRILKATKGYRGGRSTKVRLAKTAIKKAGVYAYRDRRRKKRDLRALWLIRINAACRNLETTYSKFIDGLKKNNIEIDRKILANLAENHPKAFSEIVKLVR